MKTLLETIKDHDAKMEALKRVNNRLSESLMRVMDELIDRDLTLCIDNDYVTEAFQLLENRGLVDSTRKENFISVQEGMCDQSVQLKRVVGRITGMED
jgi:hypothetical protein